MKFGKALQNIGYVLFGIGVIAKIVTRLSDGETSDMLSNFQLLKLLGLVFWISGFAIMEIRKRRTKNEGKEELNKPPVNQS
ncbi:hypothetical protein [Maribacter sp. R86514]|uniref:hypothetical protein n=1 Tax=Maribacter sp. R86514 TaxID=3093854 RepID=UPI0037C90A89